MDNKVTDYFTGAAGALTSHTPDTDIVGGGWSSAGSPQLDGSGNLNVITSEAVIDVGELDNTTISNVTNYGLEVNSTLHSRYSDSNNHYKYDATSINGYGNSSASISKVVSGTTTQLTSNSTPSTPSVFIMSFDTIGSSLEGFMDFVSKVSTTDTSIVTGTKVGISASSNGDVIAADFISGAPWDVEDLFDGTGTLNNHTPNLDIQGGGWVGNATAYSLSGSGDLNLPSGNNDPAVINIKSSNADISAKTFSGAGTERPMLVARYTDSSNYYYSYVIPSAYGGNGYIYKVVSGTATQLSSTGIGTSFSVIMRFYCVSNQLKLYWDGSLKIDITDSSITSGNYVGLGMVDNPSYTGGAFEDFYAKMMSVISPSGGAVSTMMGINLGLVLFNGMIR